MSEPINIKRVLWTVYLGEDKHHNLLFFGHLVEETDGQWTPCYSSLLNDGGYSFSPYTLKIPQVARPADFDGHELNDVTRSVRK